MDQKQLWAILDTVNSDYEDDIDNLLGDSDTEFEAITEDASVFLQISSEESPFSRYQQMDAVLHSITVDLF